MGRFFEASLDLMCIAGFDGIFKRINQTWTKVLGWTEKELTSAPYLDLVHPDDIESTKSIADQIAKGGEIIHFENRYRCRDGSYRTLLWRATPDQECSLIYAVARDITEERLKERRWQALLDHANAVIFMKDLNGRYLLINKLFEELFEVRREEIVGQKDRDIFPTEMASVFWENDLEVLNAGIPLQFEEQAPHDDGPHTYLSVKFPIKDENGNPEAICGIATDITERKIAEQSLRERESSLNAILTSAVEGIVTFDRDGLILSANPAIEAIFGFSESELRGRNIGLLVTEISQLTGDPLDQAASVELRSKLTDHRQEVAGQHKKGFAFPLELSISEMTIDQELRFTAMMHDITDRKLAEADLKRSNRDLEQFAYVASHDLKEPLRMISSYLQIIEHRYSPLLDDEGKDFFRFALEGAARLRKLIDDLLTYSRVGTQSHPLETVDVETVFSEAKDALEMAIVESHAEISHTSLPNIKADGAQLRQVFQNLLANAIKFRGDSPPRIHVSCEEVEKEWRFTVEDKGLGIPHEHRERIFEIFRQLHPRDRFPGTGIGLAICKRVIERHGGRIWVDSAQPKGTRFHFTIPTGAHGQKRPNR
ncbi:MAG: PAS domain S-box protein [Verrucomicrobiae bacterium]|nr:PAS domain S-box protein [Verrucomicrobiae bacterium]